jgi:hypothetical protein
MEQSSIKKLKIAKLVKEFSAFYESQWFITVFTTASYLSHMNPVYILTSYFLKIHLNIILPSASMLPKLSPHLKFSD